MLHLNVRASNVLFEDSPNGEFCNLKLVGFGSRMSVGDNDDCDDNWEKVADAGSYGYMARKRYEGCCGPETSSRIVCCPEKYYF